MTDAKKPVPGPILPPVADAVDAADKPVRKPATPDIARAHQELLAARRGLATEIDGFTSSTKAALDIPAKVRREPLKAAALAGGAGFLLLGGPKKALRAVGRALPSRKRDPYAGLLPDEVEKVLRDTGLAKIRASARRSTATSRSTCGARAAPISCPTPARRCGAPTTRSSGPLGTVGARKLVEKLFAADLGGTPPRRPRRPGWALSGRGADRRGGTEGGTRTRTPSRAPAPKAGVSAVPPLPRPGSVARAHRVAERGGVRRAKVRAGPYTRRSMRHEIVRP